MRAARYYGKEDIRVEHDIPEPTCGPGQVKVAPAFTGICGTDLHEYLGGPTFCPVKPHPITNESIPITLGHEFSGIIAEVGSDVQGLKQGQHVVVQPTLSCWKCVACESGAENACARGGFVGLSGGGGGLSDYVVVPSSFVIPIPDNIPLDTAALVEPLSVAWHAVSAAPLDQPGATVLVLGGGPIGLAILQALKPRRPRLVITAEVAPARQRFAAEFGADHVLDPRNEDVVTRVKELCSDNTNGKGVAADGVDVVFDCAGVRASIKTACEAIRPRGTVVNVAIWEGEVPFAPNALVFREGKYIAVLGYQKKDFVEVVGALGSGQITPAGMITKRIKLEDVVEEGVKTLITDKDNHVKILVDLKAQ